MIASDFISLLPILVLTVGATLMVLQISFYRRFTATLWLTAATLVATLLVIPSAASVPAQVTPLLKVDDYALLFTALFTIAALVTTTLAADYLRTRIDEPEEFLLLLLLATLGAIVLAHATHLASLILGMELLGVSLYALIGYPDNAKLPLEAAVKYLVLSAAATAILLFGFALMYAVSGQLTFSNLGQRMLTSDAADLMATAGATLILVGLAFKLSLVPFHMWTPDVYQGAPSPVTAFLATVSKAAIFVVLLRLFIDGNLFRYTLLINAIALMAFLSMLGGNLLALLQNNLKRMLGYSSIAHMGYLAVVLVVAGDQGNQHIAVEAASYYLVAYTATTLAAFALLSALPPEPSGEEGGHIDDISGLFWRHPLFALTMTVAMLSLAGIPLTAGFIAKFYVISAAVSGLHWVLLAALVLGSGIGIYYYLRAVYWMTLRRDHPQPAVEQATPGLRAVSWVLIAGILLLGVLPQPLIAHIRSLFG